MRGLHEGEASCEGKRVVVVTGLCHGPGCREDAKTGPWCGTACEAKWHRQFHWLYGDGEAPEPVMVRLIEEDDGAPEEHLTSALRAAVEVDQQDLEHRFVEAMNQQPAPPPLLTRPASSSVEDIQAAYAMFGDLPRREPFKLTREQRDALLTDTPSGRVAWRVDGSVLDLMGVPIELVEWEWQSTPYRLWCERNFGPGSEQVSAAVDAAYPLVASTDQQVAQSGWRAWFRMRRTS